VNREQLEQSMKVGLRIIKESVAGCREEWQVNQKSVSNQSVARFFHNFVILGQSIVSDLLRNSR